MIKGPQPTIADSIDTFIRAKESEGTPPRRVKKLRLQLDQFEEFMSAQSKLFPSLSCAHRTSEMMWGYSCASTLVGSAK